ncbi:PHP domain-containing protein [Cellulosilyticum sp. I15G10I2]|uniref:PHP domain-containing protein n=1 Tax=Cellulosilyticum sp. I15G10I2 TaxID=1892843 RepID=UPI00085BFD75|nr:PHP domain-containing protein [Cellulosilyticum sp. I15G10I2]
MKLIDLHVHSNISDGTLSPTDLAIYAKAKGLSAIALTDHDTISGIEACALKGLEIDLTVVPGIEFSAEYKSGEIHILGYYIDHHSDILEEKLKSIIQNRVQRNAKMVEKLNTLGLIITEADLLGDNPPETILTRAHVATALYKKGYVKTRSEAFDKYIGHDKPAYIPRVRVTPEECIKTIHLAGGLAVLAHPNLYGLTSFDKELLLKELITLGLDGVETHYSTHTKEDVQELSALCLKYKLLPTGGSDFHGENKPGLDIGIGYGDLKIPYDILDAMHNRLGSAHK